MQLESPKEQQKGEKKDEIISAKLRHTLVRIDEANRVCFDREHIEGVGEEGRESGNRKA